MGVDSHDRSHKLARLVPGLLGMLALTMLPGVTTCNTTCTDVDAQGNPIEFECVQCSIPDSVPCMANVWYVPAGSTCLDEQRPALEDGALCDFAGEDDGVCSAQVCQARAFACTEQGILDAIATTGGPHTFACAGPTTVVTEAEIIIDNDVILDGAGTLTIDANGSHRVVSISDGVTVELRGLILTNGRHSYGAGILSFGTLKLTDSTVSENLTTFNGGGVYNIGGTVTLQRTTVSGNRAGSLGGGINNFNDISDGSNGTLTVIDSSIVNNYAGNLGGGVYSIGGTTTTVTNSTIEGNTGYSGGGMNASGVVSVANSSVLGNTAEGGEGGAFRAAGTFTLLELTNSTVSGNAAAAVGGGISTIYEATVIVASSTITGNSGSAFRSWLGTSTVLKNTLIEGPCSGFGTSSAGGNIESPGNTCGLIEPMDQVDVSAEDLWLGPLADNGGPTMTRALLPGSVALDATPEAMCEVDEDQRGVSRPQGDACDVGAFELAQ